MKKFLSAIILVVFMQSLAAKAESLEPLLGLNVDKVGVTFQVFSGGCTNKGSFKVNQLETFPVQLQLIRINQDYCEAYLPFGTKVKFTFAELGLKVNDTFTISNPTATFRVIE